ncbi:N-acetylmuramoyl-L-alanine amidase [Ignatzschineria sp. RMDPL8A]|uniref:N-acetylmuramoyl-L-alanine amidase n=1 Tax=Ignatzschineria sp. RMDPL8A TaxID=2999236 RepID=UPI0024466711|nr:N-acetylmuramoyl-L-alanine amidase [Ignatzschineria sp. RMDPL8A]MDG9730099.1 N-acetylmuramoyl-L-alanine amidase [Ignatzschineria sp. RMDPL8A]
MVTTQQRHQSLMQWFFVLLLLFVGNMAFAKQALVGEGRGTTTNKGELRIVFPIDEKVSINSFRLASPARLVIDIPNAKLRKQARSLPISNRFVTGVRLGTQQGTDLRIVVDLKQSIPASTALMKSRNGYELVILLSGDGRDTPQSDLAVGDQTMVSAQTEIQVAKTVPKKNILIVLDPGHGGKDPGALGRAGTREKDVVLEIGKKLRDKINRERGMRAVMTRDRDVFIPLRERVLIARRHKADMFVSLHADAGSSTADGASVYILSTSGASSEAARMLAKAENRSDLIGGVKISDKDDAIASMLLDISQDATIEASNALGKHLLSHLGKHANLHKKNVERAGFAVLKAPDIPSVLVETGFISNPNEERKLKSARHQSQLADDILAGIKAYYRERPATEIVYTKVAQKQPAAQPKPQVVTPPVQVVKTPPPAKTQKLPEIKPQAKPQDNEIVFPSIQFTSTAQGGKQVVPPPVQLASKPNGSQRYITQEGDTIRGIAKKFGILEGQLKRANQLPNNQLRVPIGTELVIPR